MFKSYIHRYLGYNSLENEYNYEITIHDNEFVEKININAPPSARAERPVAATAIIKIYSQKNLDVSYNLFLLMKNEFITYDWLFKDQLYYYYKFTKNFSEYQLEIEKYIKVYESNQIFS